MEPTIALREKLHAMLDWIKNRNASQQQSTAEKSQDAKPETAKQMYTREATRETANQKPLTQMPPEQQAKVDAIKETLAKATQHMDKNTPTSAPAPGGGSESPEAARQKMSQQDKAAPALSPTDASAGNTVSEKTQSAPQQSPKAPQNTPGQTSPTLPRPRPSWER